MSDYNYTFSVHYPDGTKGSRPKDGEIWVSLTGDNWQWDDFMGSWVRGYGGNHSQVKPGDLMQDQNFDEFPNYSAHHEKECECGKDKHGFAAHTRWCKKHEEYSK